MPTLDLRAVARTDIKILAGEACGFTIEGDGADLTNITDVVMVITNRRAAVVQTLTPGSGITLGAAIMFSPQPLTVGDYRYNIEFTTADGEQFRLIDAINATNE